MNLANKLTLLRVILIPFFIVCFYIPNLVVNTISVNNYLIPYANLLGLVIFLLAAITDFIDGYIARKYNMITDFGKFMDPLADKLLVVSAMLWFVEAGQMPAWTVLIVVAREFAVTGLRLVAVDNGRVIAAGWSGKVKTATTMVCICLMLLPIPAALNAVCVALIVATTVYSGAEYFIKNRDVLNWNK